MQILTESGFSGKKWAVVRIMRLKPKGGGALLPGFKPRVMIVIAPIRAFELDSIKLTFVKAMGSIPSAIRHL
ncbi:hypothetical protein QWY93_19140 [Echinicola jeungdonensis]|uniref:hypothetical protein n=1 Tax=Echinicola jeungdonensis TaxID=709343 RepID=UPI0025B45D37|nr:hypothetical protein [Echinicola jeungdonensis]MDN3671377.1 hypothetical protein [Echinicola jeungdonensis]